MQPMQPGQFAKPGFEYTLGTDRTGIVKPAPGELQTTFEEYNPPAPDRKGQKSASPQDIGRGVEKPGGAASKRICDAFKAMGRCVAGGFSRMAAAFASIPTLFQRIGRH